MSEKKKTVDMRSVQFRGGPGMFAETEHAKDIKGTLKRIFTYILKEKSLLISLLLVVIFGTCCGVLAPSLQSRAIDIIAGVQDGVLGRILILMLAVYLLYSASQFFQDYFSAHLSQRIVKRLREELFGKIIDLPIKYMDEHSHGDMISRMTNDVENISTTVSQSLPSLFSGIFTIVGTLSIMLYYCWQLTLLSCITVLLTVASAKLLSKKVRTFSRMRQTYLGMLNGAVEEMVSGYRTVAAYNHQEASIADFCETSDRLTKAGIWANSIASTSGPIMNCISNLGFVVIAAFGGFFAIRGIISVGVISAFIIYAKQFSRPINQIANIYSQIQTAIAGAERVFAVLDEESESTHGEAMYESDRATVRFSHVDFSYQEGHPVLRDFSLTVPSGKKVALVGATGSGKTTVVNLLMRYYDINSGDIYINDQNLRDISRPSLRKKVAIVLQGTVLFTDTVRSNLKYGNEQATDEQMTTAAEMSRCNKMIAALPQGYDTILTGAGSNISQGQRQLLAIARAFIADPEILILDEATSNVDTRTEKAIQNAMQLIMKDRTSIVIAHRLSTIRDADIIVVMDSGRIVESGRHEELLAQRGKYYALYMSQYAGFET